MNLKLTLALFCAAAFRAESRQPFCAQHSREYVVLLHGLGRSSLSMKRLEWTLTRAGYHVVNVSYPSRKFPIEILANDFLHKLIAEKIPRDAAKIHFVTHSLGGIILRQYLSVHSVTKLGIGPR